MADIESGRLQNLRDFTVQIRVAGTETIVGTGVAVSLDGKIVTCAHVVKAAGVEPHTGDGAEVGVYFPQALGGERKDRRAVVEQYFPEHDDDVVLLRLTEGPPPLAPGQVAVLGSAGDSDGHKFRSYGYRRLDRYIAGIATGEIQGQVEPPQDLNLLSDPVQLNSSQINCGMSGSAVLDTERNLVVGLVSETLFPDLSTKDRDTAWAVDGYVLGFEPLELPLHDQPLPLRTIAPPRVEIELPISAAPAEHIRWNNAPPALDEFTGREALLALLDADWANPAIHVAGLIGFGGEGKSSLARQWVQSVIDGGGRGGSTQTGQPPKTGSQTRPAPASPPSPAGVFWWGFYENRSVDEFFEAALDYISGGRIDPRRVPSSSVRAQIIGAMLGAGRYLFVLDGLEVLQGQEGDRYGLLESADLRALLEYFAAPGHASFCLVTSRAPLLDLLEYTSYRHHDVERLLPEDGRRLLERLGVRGRQAELDRLVAAWDGHALTLSLVGSLLVKLHQGDIAHAGEIDLQDGQLEQDVPAQYRHVSRILRRYDEHLTQAEQAFMTLFGAFRTPVRAGAFEKVFRAATSATDLNAPLSALSEREFRQLLKRLEQYRLLRRDPVEKTYTTHPLIRNHYLARLTRGDPGQERATHEKIKDYYLSLAGEEKDFPSLEDLKPLIEVVHHACRAGTYDEAWNVYWSRIQALPSAILAFQLGAYDTDLNLLYEFFPGNDNSKEPQLANPVAKGWILNEIGLCLKSLGRLRQAAAFFERGNAIALEMQDWHNVSVVYHNLGELHIHLGDLAAGARAAGQALEIDHRTENKRDEIGSLICQAWAAHLRGDLPAAAVDFQQAEALQREIEPDKRYLYSLRGVWHAEHLRRAGGADYARRVTEANLETCERNHWADDWSRSLRILGDLEAQAGGQAAAGEHYAAALKLARGISKRDVLIEALLGRGRWAAKYAQEPVDLGNLPAPEQAMNDLNEALGYALEGEYRLYEADIRVGLAWAQLAAGEPERARAEATRALEMSREMGYHWGVVDAQEVLGTLAA